MIFDLSNYNLLETNPPELGDLVRFNINNQVIDYQVAATYLNAINDWNDKIFIVLNILSPREFCTKYYGYRANEGIWPCYKRGDYKALARVLIALFDKIAGVSGNSNIKKITLSSWNGTIETLQEIQ